MRNNLVNTIAAAFIFLGSAFTAYSGDLQWGSSQDVVDFSRWQSAGEYGCPDNQALVGFYVKSSGYPYVNDKIKCAAPSTNELQVCFQTEISSDWSNTAGTEASCPLNFFVKNINTSGSNTIGAWTDLTCCTWPYVKYDVEETFSPNWNYNNTFIGVADGQYINGFTRTSTSAKFQSLGDFYYQQSID